jgi:hypothetical protein
MLIESDLNPSGVLFGDFLRIRVFVNAQTGKVQEVEFRFAMATSWIRLPPERYYAIEQSILQNITVELSEAGRASNYVDIDSFVNYDDIKSTLNVKK